MVIFTSLNFFLLIEVLLAISWIGSTTYKMMEQRIFP